LCSSCFFKQALYVCLPVAAYSTFSSFSSSSCWEWLHTLLRWPLLLLLLFLAHAAAGAACLGLYMLGDDELATAAMCCGRAACPEATWRKCLSVNSLASKAIIVRW